jgi:16S rRNA (guanine527-N7)-methyltransferase
LAKRARKAGIFLPDDLAEQLSQYYELLDRWNRKINLTALDNADEAIDRLVLEPIVAARQLPSTNANLMDIGSGGGSPAIPVKLCVPSIALTMVEAKARKSAFLREAVRTLRLEHAVVETARYEELLARPDLHETFDVLSLRAVRVEVRALFTLQAFVKRGGLLFLFRGASGPDAPDVVPPLRWVTTVPLVETLQSRLTLLQKVI